MEIICNKNTRWKNMKAHTSYLFTNIFQIKLGLPSIDRWYWCVYLQSTHWMINIHLIWCVHSEHTMHTWYYVWCICFHCFENQFFWWFLNSCWYLVINILIHQMMCWHDLFERWGLQCWEIAIILINPRTSIFFNFCMKSWNSQVL